MAHSHGANKILPCLMIRMQHKAVLNNLTPKSKRLPLSKKKPLFMCRKICILPIITTGIIKVTGKAVKIMSIEIVAITDIKKSYLKRKKRSKVYEKNYSNRIGFNPIHRFGNNSACVTKMVRTL